MHIEIFSDVVCPWCYVGKRRFETALQQFDGRDEVTVTWRSFQLDPTTVSAAPDDDVPYAQRMADKFGGLQRAEQLLASMTKTAAAEGLDYHFEIAKPANTFDAHRLLHLAAQRGRQGQLKEALLSANFTHGRAIGDTETLRDIAVEVGLDRDEVTRVLAGDSYAEAVRADQAAARAYGISGVPFFVIDHRYGVSGAQPAEVLLDAMQQARNEGVQVGAGDREASCADEACAT